jgi:manganese efflux pump family protein
MAALLLLGFLLGLDDLQVGAGLGLTRISTARRWAFAGSCALWETVMPLLGLALGRRLALVAGSWGEGIGIGMLALSGLLIILLSRRDHDADEDLSKTGSLALAGLPLWLSLDNLAAGVGLGSLGFPVVVSALVIGLVSGSLCAVGLFSGGWLRRWVPRRAELWSGAYLLILAVGRVVWDRL